MWICNDASLKCESEEAAKRSASQHWQGQQTSDDRNSRVHRGGSSLRSSRATAAALGKEAAAALHSLQLAHARDGLYCPAARAPPIPCSAAPLLRNGCRPLGPRWRLANMIAPRRLLRFDRPPPSRRRRRFRSADGCSSRSLIVWRVSRGTCGSSSQAMWSFRG